MDKLLYVPNPLLRQKADKIQSVGIKEKEIAKKMMQIMIKAPGVGSSKSNWNSKTNCDYIFCRSRD